MGAARAVADAPVQAPERSAARSSPAIRDSEDRELDVEEVVLEPGELGGAIACDAREREFVGCAHRGFVGDCGCGRPLGAIPPCVLVPGAQAPDKPFTAVPVA